MRSPPHLWLSILLGCLTSACAHARDNTAPVAVAPQLCPAGTQDFGSGMVAIRLPAELGPRLKAAHLRVSTQLAPSQHEPYRSMPFLPHVSLIYGLDMGHQGAVGALLGSLPPGAWPTQLCFGGFEFWDNAAQQTTSIVLRVRDDQAHVHSMHDALVRVVGKPQRFAFHPHVTLGFARLGERLSEAQQAELQKAIGPLCWTPEEVYWTNRCGQVIAARHWPQAADH